MWSRLPVQYQSQQVYWPLESTLAPGSGSDLKTDLLPGQVVTQLVSVQNRTSRTVLDQTLQVSLQSLLQFGRFFWTPQTMTNSWMDIYKHSSQSWIHHGKYVCLEWDLIEPYRTSRVSAYPCGRSVSLKRRHCGPSSLRSSSSCYHGGSVTSPENASLPPRTWQR